MRPGDDLALIDCRVDSARSLIVLDFGGTLDGLLLERVEQVGTDTLQRYLVGLFGTSSHVSVYDTKATNSNHEHILRLSGDPIGGETTFASVHDNAFSNLGQHNGGPRGDMGKSTVILQVGRFHHVEDNTLDGPSGAGPLGEGDGLGNKQWRVSNVRIENNRMSGWQADHGLSDATVLNNTVDGPITIDGWVDAFDRTVERVTLTGNTGGTLTVGGRTKQVIVDGLILDGDSGTPGNPMPALRLPADMSGITLRNVKAPLRGDWPHAKGSLAIVGSQNDRDSYKRAGELPGVEAAK